MRTTALCLVSVLLAGASAADLELVRDGKPVAQIVIPHDPPELIALAAEELNLHLGKMSGAQLAQVAPGDVRGPAVYLGAPDENWAQEANLAALAFGGFVAECRDDRLVLAGKVPEGTLNAVYWLLEELGVRWYLPTELGENIPRLATVAVPTMKRRVQPRFVNRRNHGIDSSIVPDGDIWRRRQRITSHALNVPFNRYSHNLYTIFPPSRYGQTHPEYFPLRQGRRYIPTTDHAQEWQPCTSNPEVVRLTIERARQWFAEHPECNYFSVGINDSAGWWECDNCTALDIPGYTFRGRPVRSERYFTFVRQVAEAVAQTHPDKYISCIAYGSVEPLPRGVEIPDNVFVVITQDVAQWHDPAYRAADMELARAWAQAAGAFGSYDYTGLTWTMPRVYPHLMAESLRFYDEVGAVAVTNEAYPTWWYAGPQMYLRAKLMWDPQQDPDAVLWDFYSGFFGPAAAPMKTFYDLLEARIMVGRPGKWFEGLGNVLEQLDLWRPEDLVACRQALAEAQRLAASDPRAAARVDFVARGFALADAMLEEYWLAQRLQQLGASAAVSTPDLLGQLEDFLEAAQRREQVWESIKDDELLSGIYTRILQVRPERLASWRRYLDNAPVQACTSLLSRPGELQSAQIEQLVARAPAHLAHNIRAMYWARRHPEVPNLCVNGGFEDTAPGAAPEGEDWVTTNTPPGWSKWDIDGAAARLTWEQSGGHTEPRCVKATGVRNGCFIQPIAVRPGEQYLASVWVRSIGSTRGVPQLVVRWRDAEGKWTANEHMHSAPGEGGADCWQELIVVFTVPEGAAQAVLLPGAKDQEAGDVVYFDDVRVIRLPDDLGAQP